MKSRFEVAMDAARKASEFLLSHEAMARSVKEKAENDYVTEADKATEELIISTIREHFPQDSILGEESGEISGSPNRWIIDPIDGTVDFMNSFPCYTVSIAYQENGETRFGIVAVPRQGEYFWAEKGKGAYLNGERIRVRSGLALRKSIAIMGPPHRHPELLSSYFEKMYSLYSLFSDQRSLGSAAISLSYVASGRVAAYYETMLEEYDVAAGVLLVREAGGVVDIRMDGHHVKSIIAGSKESVEGIYGKIGHQTCLV